MKKNERKMRLANVRQEENNIQAFMQMHFVNDQMPNNRNLVGVLYSVPR